MALKADGPRQIRTVGQLTQVHRERGPFPEKWAVNQEGTPEGDDQHHKDLPSHTHLYPLPLPPSNGFLLL